MKRAIALALIVACAAASAAAQGTKAPVKTDSKALAPSAANKVPLAKAPQVQVKQAPAPGTKAAPQAGTTTKSAASATGTKAPPPAQQPAPTTPTIMREVFAYQQEGRRDPFATLLSSSDLRPTVADLKLTGILYDENGSNSVAVMRDIGTNVQYRVTTGQTLGRMKVALIKRKAVIFSIEAFGMNRQDSLVLGDTTKVRAK